jgi:hypothetical protein
MLIATILGLVHQDEREFSTLRQAIIDNIANYREAIVSYSSADLRE